jgi:hypothetical protein
VRVNTENGEATGKYTGFEFPPPGVTTVTAAVVDAETSEARIAAFSCDELTNVVTRGVPFQFTVEAATNPEPLTVNVNPATPDVVLGGTKGWLIKGTGLAAKAGSTVDSTNKTTALTHHAARDGLRETNLLVGMTILHRKVQALNARWLMGL